MKTTKKKTVFKRGISFLLSLLMVFTGIMAGASGKLTARAEEPDTTEAAKPVLENLVVYTDTGNTGEKESVYFISCLTIPGIEESYKESDDGITKVSDESGYYIALKKDGETENIKKNEYFSLPIDSASEGYAGGYDEETNEYIAPIVASTTEDYNAINTIEISDIAKLSEGKYTLSLCDKDDKEVVKKDIVLDKIVLTGGNDSSLTYFYSSEYCKGAPTYSTISNFLHKGKTEGKIPTAIKVGETKIEIVDYKYDELLKGISGINAGKNGVEITGEVVYTENTVSAPTDLSWAEDNFGAIRGKIAGSGAYAVYIYRQDEESKKYTYYGQVSLGDITDKFPAKQENGSYSTWYDSKTGEFEIDWTKDWLFKSGKYTFGIVYSPSDNNMEHADQVFLSENDAITVEDRTRLSAPENLRWGSEDKSFVARWSGVEGTYLYRVNLVNDKTGIVEYFDVEVTSCDLSEHITDQTAGNYRFQVQALSEDLSKKGHSKYSDLSEIAGLSEAAEKAAADVAALVPENGDVAAVAKSSAGAEITDTQKKAVEDAAKAVVESAKSDTGRTALSDAMKTEETQEAIDTISKAYGVVNNITVEEATVSDNVAISADDKNKIEIIGAELSGEENDKLSINISNASANPGIDTGVYKSVLAFDMKLQKGNEATKTEVTDLKVPVTVKLPVPENMNALNLYILHFKSDGSFDKIYPAFDKAENGTMLAVFTLTHFSTFAFVEEKAEESGDSGSSDPSGNSGDSGESGGSSGDSGQSGGTTPPLPLPAGSGSGSGSGDGNESGSETGDSENTDDSGKQDEDAGKEDKDDEGKKDDEEKDPAETGETKNVLSIDEEKNEAVVYDPVSEGGKSTVNLQVIKSGKVYRMYDGREHFYTKVDDERSFLLDNYFKEEVQDGFEVISADEKDAVPVFRFYNKNNGGMHFFTTNEKEAKWLIEQGWGYEGIAFYAYEKGSEKGTPQYRLLNPNSLNGEHNWTSSKEERDWLVAQGWQDEGFSWNIK